MTFPRYPAYRDSGIEWLGEVPGHWEVLPLKRDVGLLTSGSRGWAEHYSENGAAFIRIGNLTRDSIRLDLSDLQRVDVPNGAEGERTKVLPGDLLFSITAYLGSVAIAPEGLETAYVSQHVALARLKQCRFLPAWVGYVALSNVGKTYLETQGYGGTKVQLSLDDVANLIVTTPPLPEQTAIASFLDRETGRIDGLVAEQERLIALLQEKRQAVISHAVTKGLNPAAPMKPSEIDWLGDIPAHWEVVRLKHSITKIEQGWSPQCESEPASSDEWGVLKIGCVNGDFFNQNEQKALPSDVPPLPNYEIAVGDILVSRGNTPNLVGMATFVDKVRPRLLLCDLLYRFRAMAERAEGRFLVFALRSPIVRFQIERDATGTSASMKKISQEDISEFIICVPPLDEQQAVVSFIELETAQLDILIAESRHAIDLLKERRNAMITAAVTGKIDVRELVEQEAA